MFVRYGFKSVWRIVTKLTALCFGAEMNASQSWLWRSKFKVTLESNAWWKQHFASGGIHTRRLLVLAKPGHFLSLGCFSDVHKATRYKSRSRPAWSWPWLVPCSLVNVTKNNQETRNTLDCDQSNYSSRIVFVPHRLPIEFGQTGNSAIQSADPENHTVEPNL